MCRRWGCLRGVEVFCVDVNALHYQLRHLLPVPACKQTSNSINTKRIRETSGCGVKRCDGEHTTRRILSSGGEKRDIN